MFKQGSDRGHICVLKKKQTLTLYAMEMGFGGNLTGHRETRKEGFVVYEGDCACLSMTETDEESSKAPLSFTPTPRTNPRSVAGLCRGESGTIPVFKQFITLGT